MSKDNSNALDQESFKAFIEQLRRFVRNRLVPAEAEVIELNAVPDDIMAEMRDIGLFGITTPQKYGGAEMNMSQYIETVREMSWAMPGFRAILSINIGMLTTALLESGTEAQREYWFEKMMAGSVGCFGLTEPDTGSDVAAVQTRAIREGDDYIISGAKRYISNAPFADFGLMMVRTEAEALPKNRHISAFMMPLDLPGVSIGKPDKKMGQAGAQIADIVFDNVRVPKKFLLGEVEGAGFTVAMQALDKGRLSVAAAATGYAARILETGLRYSTERKAFGERIGNFQLIQAMLADSKAEIYAAECMLRDAAQRADNGQAIPMEASCVKMFATEMCNKVADRVVQIHGGAGYLEEYEAERFLRDVRVYRIYEGTTQIQQLIIAKRMLREFDAGQ